ncbi:MAG: porin [Acidobacteriaceae bacterium]|nr:porin [Acidobacteriaceae bacterium]MBV9295879.1 porin [Acidobacteriaceae bacterium]
MSLPTAKSALPALAVLICSTLWSQTPTDTSGSQNSSPAATPSQTPAPAPAPAPAAPTWTTIGKVNFSGYLDAYYSFNDNHPDGGFNQFYNFNDETNQVGLSMAKLTASVDPAPVGFRLDLGVGRTFDIVHTPKADPEFFDYVEQAYVSVKPKDWKGFEADFGDFVTSAGAEVIEAKDNWNYSRSLLFALAIPYYHFGIRTSMPIGSNLNVGVQVVDGWNAVVDDHGNNMKTVGLTGAITRKKYTWSHNYYIGPQYTGSNDRNRSLYDTTLLLTPNDKVNAYLNFDYGEQHRIISGHDHWIGFAGALHFQLNKYFAISPRAEYYNDVSGFTTGTPQKLHEVTVTGEYKVMTGLLTRLEFRRDGSNVYFFDRGTVPAASKSQTTATIGLIAFFPPPKS